MKLLDKETSSIAKAVSDILEGGKKKKTEEVKYPHMMYHPKTGEEVEVKNEDEHNKYSEKGWVHEKPKVNEVEEPRAKGEKEFKDKHATKKSGMNTDGSVTKESSHDKDDAEEEEEEQSPKQKKYQAFFAKALKKFGVKSPEELDGDKKKEFFDYVDKNWEGENEAD